MKPAGRDQVNAQGSHAAPATAFTRRSHANIRIYLAVQSEYLNDDRRACAGESTESDSQAAAPRRIAFRTGTRE